MIIEPIPGVALDTSRLKAAAEFCGVSSWPDPWDQDEFCCVNAGRLAAFSKQDAENVAALAALTADLAAEKDNEAAKEASIADITDGLDRETVRDMAKKALKGRTMLPFWPEINDDCIMTFDEHSSRFLTWERGSSSWSIGPVASDDCGGSGYGRHAD